MRSQLFIVLLSVTLLVISGLGTADGAGVSGRVNAQVRIQHVARVSAFSDLTLAKGEVRSIATDRQNASVRYEGSEIIVDYE